MNITTDEVARVFPRLSEQVKQAIYIAILEDRNVELEKLNADMTHQIEILESAVKVPEVTYEVRRAVQTNGVNVKEEVAYQ